MSERRAGLVNGGVIAHNGLSDWILQRATAVILVLYTLIFIANLVWSSCTGLPVGKAYLVTLDEGFGCRIDLSYLSRMGGDKRIWMDIKPVGIKIGLQIFSIFWLLVAGFGLLLSCLEFEIEKDLVKWLSPLHNISGMPRRRFDSVIVGAGGAGMRCSLQLAQSNATVAVLSKVFPTRSHTVAAQVESVPLWVI